MDKRLLRLEVENFRSLRKISLPLRDLNVLVGANGAGKTNVLQVFDFLAKIIRTDLEPALDSIGGFDEVVFRGGEKSPASMRVRVTATWTTHSSINAPDEYDLRITRRTRENISTLERAEKFSFKRIGGRGRRITISGERASVVDTGVIEGEVQGSQSIGIRRLSSGLSTLPRLTDEAGGNEVSAVADRLASFRVFDVAVAAARSPSRWPSYREQLAPDASNIAAFLLSLSHEEPRAWSNLVDDALAVLPQLRGIEFAYPSGAAREVVIVLHEAGLRVPTQLADASYGTIRLLGLLALLYDPSPAALTCVEEVDHGLHPQALELLVERLREASERTQLIIATHSPSLADRLRPDELIICERRSDGSSAIPAVRWPQIEKIVAASGDQPLGELWFSGALGGDL
ncbi:MAG TPA: AAA family ATPase [Streptosporangiaceae bacterium]|nr:AAA family ATPase [Streptosporangiaceae bacterium]